MVEVVVGWLWRSSCGEVDSHTLTVGAGNYLTSFLYDMVMHFHKYHTSIPYENFLRDAN